MVDTNDPSQTALELRPIGVIHKHNGDSLIEIYPRYAEALNGLEQFSHINVLYWFHENDTPDQRNILQVHPCGNEQNPLTGVFATHAPVRPNPIALTVCKILSIEGNRINVDDIDAYDGSPVIDIKSYFPPVIKKEEIRAPDWKKEKDPS
jgi:tRNA-Thr(GGU) m(6)t(6)A37 methyltransferase TsaA